MSMHNALVTFTEALQQKLVAAYSLAWRMKKHVTANRYHYPSVYTNLNCCESKF